MGSHLIWDDRWNIGIDVIDKEHKKLFHIINKLYDFSEQEDKGPWVCHEGIKYFKEHALKHFKEEEKYMALVSYQDLETHRRLHEDFSRHTLPALEKELEQTGYAKEAIHHFMGVCAGWLIGHTLTDDYAMAHKEMSKWGNLMPREEQFVIRQTILRRLHEMFGLDTQVISECYGGERFGSGIYCHLIYGDKEGMQQEVILVFEEKLLVHMMGRLFADDSGKFDMALLNMARDTARQFAESIRKHFPSVQEYRLERENLLTYEQFQRVFKQQMPQYSLLFDTQTGYFAYCAMTPQQRAGGSFAVRKCSGVQEWDQKQEKKKLLVVDDSDTVRLAVKGLLQKDYQILTADSAAAAIRSMALERPDLVLLDYEMPVCNGAQALLMIRSEKEFTEIPVFFLTSKVDKESVSKMLALKPQGYLLKSSKPTEIKKKIDHYFQRRGS